MKHVRIQMELNTLQGIDRVETIAGMELAQVRANRPILKVVRILFPTNL